MSESLFPTFRKMSQTPMRDIFRFRLTGRLDWKSQLAAANLPGPAAELISRVVKQTRLFRLEKAAVANELASHFLDGLAGGGSVEDLVERFGDERIAAKLIRRAKRRGRPMLWHVLNFCFRATVIFIAVYIVLLVRFCVGRPTPTVDYIARLNQPVANTSQNDRAWPLWREAILAVSSGSTEYGNRAFPKEIGNVKYADPMPTWDETASWLDHHAQAVELTRQAAAKRTFGFVYGPGGSQNDPALFGSSTANQPPEQALIAVLLPHLNYMRWMGTVLSLDAKLAAIGGDGLRFQSDLESLMGLSRQLRQSDGMIVTHLVALGLDAMIIDRLEFMLVKYPGLLKDDQLVRLAHEIAKPRMASDLVQLQTERYVFHDIVQRLFTDDGHGDGHITLTGVRSTATYVARKGPTPDPWEDGYWNTYAVASPLPMATVSRAELTATYDRIIDRYDAALSLPIRQVDFEKLNQDLAALKTNPVDKARYGSLLNLLPEYNRLQTTCERYLGERDGAIVGISLELYHRRNGHYPATLDELTPELLPETPADRITGDPVKYRLIDGKPVVYSVGVDRVDDAGTPPEYMLRHTANPWQGAYQHWSAAEWGKLDVVPQGDWILYSPEVFDE